MEAKEIQYYGSRVRTTPIKIAKKEILLLYSSSLHKNGGVNEVK